MDPLYREAPEPEPLAPTPIAPGSAVLATFRCEPCDRYFDAYQAKIVPAGNACLYACPVCGIALREERSRAMKPFGAVLVSAFTFPFHPVALGALGALGLVGYVVSVLTHGIFAAFGFVLALVYFLEVIRATGDGADEAPYAVDFIGMGDVLRPLFRIYVATCVALTPVIFTWITMRHATLVIALTALMGIAYFPAGLLIAAHEDSALAPLNLLRVVRLVRATGPAYWLTAGVVLGLTAAGVFVFVACLALMIALDGTVPLVPRMLFHTVPLIVPMIVARALGLLVRQYAPELKDRVI